MVPPTQSWPQNGPAWGVGFFKSAQTHQKMVKTKSHGPNWLGKMLGSMLQAQGQHTSWVLPNGRVCHFLTAESRNLPNFSVF